MSLREIEQELFKDPAYKKYLDEHRDSFEIAASVMEARILKGLSQEELAKKVGTKQPSIARLESGSCLPSLSFLEKIAKALDTELILPKFKFLEKQETIANEKYIIAWPPQYTPPATSMASTLRDASGEKYKGKKVPIEVEFLDPNRKSLTKFKLQTELPVTILIKRTMPTKKT